jgi:hypothetical protein
MSGVDDDVTLAPTAKGPAPEALVINALGIIGPSVS